MEQIDINAFNPRIGALVMAGWLAEMQLEQAHIRIRELEAQLAEKPAAIDLEADKDLAKVGGNNR